jgi:hypothetical protein
MKTVENYVIFPNGHCNFCDSCDERMKRKVGKDTWLGWKCIDCCEREERLLNEKSTSKKLPEPPKRLEGK